MGKQKRRSDCPINYALELLGDRWSLLIIRDLMFKEKHYYGEFLQSEEKIATNILADRLVSLEESGMVNKTTDPGHRSKFIYRLTQKGIDLLPVLVEIINWSARYDIETAADPWFLSRVNNDKPALISAISGKLKQELGE